MLRQCHESVVRQKVDAVHLLIADGHPNAEIDAQHWPVQHVKLPCPHGDNGNTPRSVGSVLAVSRKYDFISYLDADNWFHGDHLSSLVELHRSTGASICCARRTFHRPDGSELNITEPAEQNRIHVDTSCLLIHSSAFALTGIWHLIPKPLAPVCDRIFYQKVLNDRFSIAFSPLRTVAFRTRYAYHYDLAKEPRPQNAKIAEDVFGEALRFLSDECGVAETVLRIGFYPMPSIFLRGN